MKKKMILLLAAALTLLLVLPALAAESATMAIAVDGTAAPGTTVTVTVSISQVENCTAVGLGLDYDTAIFEMVEDSFQLIPEDIKQASFKYVSGANRYVANIQMDGSQTVSGDLFRFTLKVKESASLNTQTIISGTASLRVSNTAAECALESAQVKVSCSHSYGSWTDLDNDRHQRTCGLCGATEKESHNWNSGEVTTQPACNAEGVRTYTCADCGTTKTESVAMVEHTWNEGEVTTPPTCDSKGVKTFTCTVCGKTRTEALGMLDHIYDEGMITTQPTCTQEGVKTFTCTDCGDSYTQSVPAIGHTPGEKKEEDRKEPGCESDGSYDTVIYCETCGTELERETHSLTATGHIWDSGKVTTDPTCAKEGVKTFTCGSCGDTYTEPVAMIAHSYDHDCDTDCNACGAQRSTTHRYSEDWSRNEESHWHGCTVCGDRRDETDHTPGPAATEWDPQVCTTCGYVIQAALGHTHKYSDSYSYDGEAHWFPCSGCEEVRGYYYHSYDHGCDADCNLCGYVRTTDHNYSQRLYYDETGHWHACSECGDVMELLPHVPGPDATETTDQICLDCGFVIHPAGYHEHAPNGDWRSDENSHWHQCACNEKLDLGEHTWGEGIVDAEAQLIRYNCTTCGYPKTEPWQAPSEPTVPSEPTEPSVPEQTQPSQTKPPVDTQPVRPGDDNPKGFTFQWWMVGVVIGVLLLGGVLFIIIGILTSRRKVGKYTAK